MKLHLILINADVLQLTPNKGREVKSGRNCIHAFEAQRPSSAACGPERSGGLHVGWSAWLGLFGTARPRQSSEDSKTDEHTAA